MRIATENKFVKTTILGAGKMVRRYCVKDTYNRKLTPDFVKKLEAFKALEILTAKI
jgi:hypothetical protein